MLHTHESNKYSMGTWFYGVCHLHILHFRLTFSNLAIVGFLWIFICALYNDGNSQSLNFEV